MTPWAPQPSEANDLARIHADAFAAPWSEEAIARLLSQPECFALRLDEGFILMRTIAGEAEILTLAVLAGARRRGLGRTLVAAGLEAARARGAEAAFLEVAVDNPAAIALYERAGFAAAGRRRGYYSRPGEAAVDALVMRCDLNSPSA